MHVIWPHVKGTEIARKNLTFISQVSDTASRAAAAAAGASCGWLAARVVGLGSRPAPAQIPARLPDRAPHNSGCRCAASRYQQQQQHVRHTMGPRLVNPLSAIYYRACTSVPAVPTSPLYRDAASPY